VAFEIELVDGDEGLADDLFVPSRALELCDGNLLRLEVDRSLCLDCADLRVRL
jgi:hypothetical protein